MSKIARFSFLGHHPVYIVYWANWLRYLICPLLHVLSYKLGLYRAGQRARTEPGRGQIEINIVKLPYTYNCK